MLTFAVIVAFAATQDPRALPTGTIRGRVVDSRHEPIVQARVEAILHLTTTPLRSALTDGSGCFVLAGLPLEGTTTFRIEASHKGRTAANESITLSPSSSTHAGLVLQLFEAARVGGRIVDGDGRGIAGATIVALHDPVPGYVEDEHTASDAQGKWTFAALPLGEHLLRVHAPGYRMGGRLLTVGQDTSLHLTLERGGDAKVRVDVSGLRSPEDARSVTIDIRCTPSGVDQPLPLPRSLSSITLDAHGGAELSGLLPGKLTATLRSTLVESVRPNEGCDLTAGTAASIAFVVRPRERIELRGSVTDARGTPLAGRGLEIRLHSDGTRLHALTREDGTFAVATPLANGDAFLPRLESEDLVLPFGRYEWQQCLAATPIKLVALAPRVLRGRVLDAEGEPVDGAKVSLTRVVNPSRIPGRATIAEGASGADGKFEIRAIPAFEDRLELGVTHEKGNLAGIAVAVAGPDASGPLELVLENAGQITGQVRDADGRPVAGKRIVIRASEQQDGRSFLRDRRGPLSDREGAFRIVGLAAGSYSVSCAGTMAGKPAYGPLLELVPGASKRVELVVD